MTNWYTSDHHFNHINVINFCDRPFHTLNEMHTALIWNWNSIVSANDTVYYLGDFCFEGKKQEVLKWKEKLNGHIILIRGNHDHKTTRKAFRPDCHDELAVKIGKYNCMLAHRPLYPAHWDIPVRDITNHFARKADYEKYDFIISGHIHAARLWTGRSLNVGVDMHDFTPLPEFKVLALLEEYMSDSEAKALPLLEENT